MYIFLKNVSISIHIYIYMLRNYKILEWLYLMYERYVILLHRNNYASSQNYKNFMNQNPKSYAVCFILYFYH